MGIGAQETGQDPRILVVGVIDVLCDEFFHCLIARAVFFRDGDALPGVGVDTVVVRVDKDVEAPDLIRTDSGLHDGDTRNLIGFGKIGVAVAADNEIHAPVGIESGREFFVVFKADMRQQHGEVNVHIPVGIADFADLIDGILNINQSTHKPLRFCGVQHLLGQNPDKHHAHPVDFLYEMRVEKTLAAVLQVHIGIDDRECGTLLKKQQMGQTVVHLVVAKGHHVWRQQIHDLNGGHPLKLAVDHRAAEHVARKGVDDILFLTADLVDITGQEGNTSHQLLIHLLGRKVAMQVVRVQKGEFLQVFHFVRAVLSMFCTRRIPADYSRESG